MNLGYSWFTPMQARNSRCPRSDSVLVQPEARDLSLLRLHPHAEDFPCGLSLSLTPVHFFLLQ